MNTKAIWKKLSSHNFHSLRSRRWFLGVGTAGVAVVLLWSLSGLWPLPAGAVGRTHRVMSTPKHGIWGELFKPTSPPILRLKSGDRVVMQTVSHEGILEDQGDTTQFFTNAGIPRPSVLPDQLKTK